MNRQSYPIKLNYTYDKLGRLTSVAATGGQEISYTYDAAGNRISVIVKGEAAPAPAHSNLQKPSPLENLGQTNRPANTSRRPPPPEKL